MSQKKQPASSQEAEEAGGKANPGQMKHQAQVVHRTRGRARVRLAPESRKPEHLAEVKQHLEAQEGVHSVAVDANTGSVLVKYDHETHTHEGIMGLLEDINILTGVVIPEVAEGEKEGDKLTEAIKDLNTRVYRATGRKAHLGVIAFVGLTAFGIRQTLVYGLGLELIPGPVLLIAAVELYRRRDQLKPDLNGNGGPKASPA